MASHEAVHASKHPSKNSGYPVRDSALTFGDASEACISSSLEVWARARADRERLERIGDLEAARSYVAMWPNHPPDYFADSTSLRKRRALTRAWGDGNAWASRMVLSVQTIGHFSLHARHLGLEKQDAEASGLFDAAVIARWKGALRRSFSGPLHWHLDVGDSGVLHCHVLAAFGDGPEGLRRPSAVVRDCTSYLETAVSYQYKSPAYTPELLALYWAARRERRRLPNTSGVLNPSGLRTNCPSPVLEVPLASSLPSSSPVPARAPQPRSSVSLGSARSLARVTPGAALSAFELLQGLKTPPFTPQTGARIRVLEGINAPSTYSRGVPRAPKHPYSRPGGHKRDSGGPKLLLMARFTGLFTSAPGLEKRAKSPERRPKRGDRQQEGRKRLGMAVSSSHRLVSLAPRRPLSRLFEGLRSLLRLPRGIEPLEPARPLPIPRSSESRFKGFEEKSAADIRMWSRSPVSEALRYHSRASAPSTYGGFTYADRPTKSRRQNPGPGNHRSGGYRRPPGYSGY